jgi:hypothetical protein
MRMQTIKNLACAAVLLCGEICATEATAQDAKDDAKKPIAADLYIDMEAGRPGDPITIDLLNAMTHGAGGKWSLRHDHDRDWKEPMAEFTVAARQTLLPVPVIVGGQTYKNTGKRGWACEMLTPMRAVTYTFRASHPSVSVGFFMEYHCTKKWTPIDLVAINARNGDFVVAQTTEHPRNIGMRVHTGDHWEPGGKKGSKVGITIPMEDGKLYWVSMRFVQHGESSLALFDPATFKQIGPTSTLTLTSDSPAHNLIIGRTDAHGVTDKATVSWDDFLVDWSKAAYPLVP